MKKLAQYLAKGLQVQLARTGKHIELQTLETWIWIMLRRIKR